MQFIYKRRGVSLSEEALKGYVGEYDFKIHITAKNGHLIMDYLENSEIPLYVLGNKEFSWYGYYGTFHFMRDANGKVIGVEGEFGRDNIMTYKKQIYD